MNKFEELLAKYGKTADEVTFEYENLSDEELEVAFKEAFGENEGAEDPVVEEPATEEPVVADDNSEDEPVVEEPTGEPEEKFVLKYELSHDDIRSALYSLLAATTEDGYYFTWIIEVYDNKFIYQDYMEDKFYRQDYSKDGENVVLGENKVEVFNEWLSKDEKDALETLKADYSALKAFKDNYEAAELKAQKDSVLAREEYSVLAEDEAFKALVADAEKYSVEDLETKADVIFAKFVKSNGEYSSKKEVKKADTIGLNFTVEPTEEEQAYGGLFAKDK